jgi:hypothetical protein
VTKEQLRAIRNYCKRNVYTPKELLQALKENGTVSIDAKVEDLGDYVQGGYKEMTKYLEDSLE